MIKAGTWTACTTPGLFAVCTQRAFLLLHAGLMNSLASVDRVGVRYLVQTLGQCRQPVAGVGAWIVVLRSWVGAWLGVSC